VLSDVAKVFRGEGEGDQEFLTVVGLTADINGEGKADDVLEELVREEEEHIVEEERGRRRKEPRAG
jgi:hypothetical protein